MAETEVENDNMIIATEREGSGKGVARSLRREGNIPAIVYGGKGEPVTISTGLRGLVREYSKGHFTSKVYDLNIDGDVVRVLPRQIQLHPVTDIPEHVDFLRVVEGQKIKILIPVKFINEDKSVGIKRGGVLNVVRRDIELLCSTSDIPVCIVADLDGMQIGESVHLSNVSIPEGAEVTITDRDFTIATIVGRGASTSESEEEDDEDEEGEEGEEGETEEGAAEEGATEDKPSGE